MSFFANLEPIVTKARASGQRVFLLTHSMGNWALQAAVESWFAHGNGDAALFDVALLAAADERYDGFDFPPAGRLTGLDRLAKRIAIYFSKEDAVLQISMAINLGAKRLGQDGPHDRFDTQQFPPATYRMTDCSGFDDYNINPASSHQYYRRSPGVRTEIAERDGRRLDHRPPRAANAETRRCGRWPATWHLHCWRSRCRHVHTRR